MASSVELEAPLEAQPAALVWVELKEVKFYLEVEFGAAGFAAADCRWTFVGLGEGSTDYGECSCCVDAAAVVGAVVVEGAEGAFGTEDDWLDLD